MPKVSVIIPCYNQGQYIDEAVNSVLAQTFQDFEIIIVNDGSTDEFTNEILKNYNKPKTRVIHTTNQGLSAARNNGIKASVGEYILPLDADDKIADTYLEKAVKVLDENQKIGIVYCEAEFFGSKTGKWKLQEYTYENILIANMIFCSAFFRRIDYNKTNGYDSKMIYGWEDWEFWLSLIEFNILIYKIPEICFYYRVKTSSMITELIKDAFKRKHLHSYVFYKHINLYTDYSDPITAHSQKQQIIKDYEQKIQNIKNSKSYKLGNFILKPFKFLKRIF